MSHTAADTQPVWSPDGLKLAVALGLAILFSGAFAVSLIYVSYAYTGWNAAT